MMNTKIYKSVLDLAGALMDAASADDKNAFNALYAELNTICTDNENSEKDHPVQWETLADFTEELDDAIEIYAKALTKATAINSKDFMSSIAFSMAVLQIELGHTQAAVKNLQEAKVSANKIIDKELKIDIDTLLEKLLSK